jgi:hypothetical protein
MLKLRDRVVLETSIRDAKGEFDAPFGYTEGFDQTTGEYAGLIYAKAARKSSPPARAPCSRRHCEAASAARADRSVLSGPRRGRLPGSGRTCSQRARPFHIVSGSPAPNPRVFSER